MGQGVVLWNVRYILDSGLWFLPRRHPSEELSFSGCSISIFFLPSWRTLLIREWAWRRGVACIRWMHWQSGHPFWTVTEGDHEFRARPRPYPQLAIASGGWLPTSQSHRYPRSVAYASNLCPMHSYIPICCVDTPGYTYIRVCEYISGSKSRAFERSKRMHKAKTNVILCDMM